MTPRRPEPTGVGVLDKVAVLLGALEEGPASLVALVAQTGMPRPTVRRLLLGLTAMGFAVQQDLGFVLGPRLGELAKAADRDRQADRDTRVQRELDALCATCRIHTARLHQYRGQGLMCVASATSTAGPSASEGRCAALGSERPAGDDPVARAARAWTQTQLDPGTAHGSADDRLPIRQPRLWAQRAGHHGGHQYVVLSVAVRGGAGQLAAVLSVYRQVEPPASSATAVYRQPLIDKVLAAAERLSGCLGHPPGARPVEPSSGSQALGRA